MTVFVSPSEIVTPTGTEVTIMSLPFLRKCATCWNKKNSWFSKSLQNSKHSKHVKLGPAYETTTTVANVPNVGVCMGRLTLNTTTFALPTNSRIYNLHVLFRPTCPMNVQFCLRRFEPISVTFLRAPRFRIPPPFPPLNLPATPSNMSHERSILPHAFQAHQRDVPRCSHDDVTTLSSCAPAFWNPLTTNAPSYHHVQFVHA